MIGKDTRGVLIEKSHDDESNTEYGVVRLNLDNRERKVDFNPYDLRYVYRLKEGESKEGQLGRVLIVSETVEYRLCTRSQVFDDDFAIEIGSSYGGNIFMCVLMW